MIRGNLMAGLEFIYCGHFLDSEPVLLHRHRADEMVLVTGGSCSCSFPERRLELTAKAGTLLYIPAGMTHDQVNHGRCETIYVVFDPATGPAGRELRLIDVGSDLFIARWFEDIRRLDNESTEETTLLGAILARLARLENLHGERQTMHPGLVKATDYLAGNYMKNISISELAVKSGVSESHLNLLFRRRFGSGPAKYLQNLRMAAAQQLLKNRYLSIAEVAEQSGYGSVNYFTRMFRNFHRTPPGRWRDLHGDAN